MKPRFLPYRWMKPERLFELGIEALTQEEFGKARRIGHALVGKQYSGGFEILARAAFSEGDAEEARRWFREGVELAPDSWGLWHAYGIMESDSGDFGAAEAALRKALASPDADRALVLVNLAELCARSGDADRALAILDEAEELGDGEYAAAILGVRISVLRRSERYAEAADLFRSVHEELDDQELLRAHGDYLFSRYKLGEDPAALREEILALSRPMRRMPDALWILRDIAGPRDGLVAYHLTARFEARVAGETSGVLVGALVAASSPEEALAMVREFEGAPAAEADRCVVNEQGHPTHPGIYQATGYITPE